MTRRMTGILICILLLCLYAPNRKLSVSHYEYYSEKVSEATDGFRIAQISDLHGWNWGKHQETLLRHLEEEAPDLIVLTGDLIDETSQNFEPLWDLVRGAAKIAPVYFAEGNHESVLSEEGQKEIAEIVVRAGGTYLANEAVRIGGNGGFWLVGMKCDGILKADIRENLKRDGLTILLSHIPQYMEKYAEYGADLVFSGHAHGGQVRLPVVGGLYAPGQGLFPKYSAGMYTSGNTTMVVSRGLGGKWYYPRFGNPPELVIVTLRRKA